jgi:hypothetical protein
MRLPIDKTQWTPIILKTLIQQLPSLEPYIQMVKLEEADDDGNAYGLIPLSGASTTDTGTETAGTDSAFVPFVIKGLELKPMDTLVAAQDGETRFIKLTEANAISAIGGLSLGTPVGEEPVGVEDDFPLDLSPPWENQNGLGGRRNGARANVSSTIRPVKLGSWKAFVGYMQSLDEKQAAEHVVRHIVTRLYPEMDRLATEKRASADPVANHQIAIFEPTPGRDAVDLSFDGKKLASLDRKTCATRLRALDMADKVASLQADDLIILDRREKSAGNVWYADSYPGVGGPLNFTEVDEPGWYRIEGENAHVYNLVQLDGSPTNFRLVASPTGYKLTARAIYGAKLFSINPERAKLSVRPARLHVGDISFLLNEKTGEATAPFEVLGAMQHGETTTINVRPLLGTHSHETLTFGNVRNVMRIGPDEVAYPQHGFKPMTLVNNALSAHSTFDGAGNATEHVRVHIFKGGNSYTVTEGRKAVGPPMGRAELAHTLMTRYGMDADQAVQTVRDVNSHLLDEIWARPKEAALAENDELPKFAKEAADLSHRLYNLSVLAGGERATLFPLLAKVALDKQEKRVGTEKDLSPDRSGPNRVDAPDNEPGSGPNQAGAGGGPAAAPPTAPAATEAPGNPQSAGAPTMGGAPGLGADPAEQPMPNIPFMDEVADLLGSYATGGLAGAEMAQVYTDLAAKLQDVGDLVARVLLLVRLGKVEFITESETKRLLDEADSFRSAILNADMLLPPQG